MWLALDTDSSTDYNKVTYGMGKVAFAVVIKKADVEAAQWEYSIRANYTRSRDSGRTPVACLKGPQYNGNRSITASELSSP